MINPAAVSSHPRGAYGPTQVSLVVPMYADKQHSSDLMTIARCLDSVLAQTDKAVEVIAVADGYQPHLHRFIENGVRENFAKAKVPLTYITAPRRGMRGGHAACILGFEYASGEYICMLNGDNVVYPDYVETMYQPEYDIVCGWVLMTDLPGRPVLTALDFTRGKVDRLNYMVRRDIAIYASHMQHLDADYDFILKALTYANGDVNTTNVMRVIGEHR